MSDHMWYGYGTGAAFAAAADWASFATLLCISDGLFQPVVTTKTHGTVVGLSICRTIIESHGGDIVADESGRRQDLSVHRTICEA
ncbi:hypothetical protein [Bradyrhizobium zhanjiangense]|uniref:hypothetical protein n=1 Tax=Bradyrhizobium zhanjiangense TaxID=1325107 RepID=UPI0019D6AEA6